MEYSGRLDAIMVEELYTNRAFFEAKTQKTTSDCVNPLFNIAIHKYEKHETSTNT